MSRSTTTRRRTTCAAGLVLALALVGSLAPTAFAETYSGGSGTACVGTNGSDAMSGGGCGLYPAVAVSQGGCAQGTHVAVAVGESGRCTNGAAASAPVAVGLSGADVAPWSCCTPSAGVSDSGYAYSYGSGGGVSASGSGEAAGSGCIYLLVACIPGLGVSGTSNAYGGTAVSGTGTATGITAVSGTGTANSAAGGVGVSATGRAYGGGENVSGETYLVTTGLLPGPVTAEQAELAAQAVTIPDAANFAQKQQALAQGTTWTAKNMVLYAGDGLGESPSSSSTTESEGTSAPPAEALNTPLYYQERDYYCLPAVMKMYMDAWGTSGYSQNSWAATLKTKHPERPGDKTAGTPLKNAVKVINTYKRHNDNMIWAQNDDPTELMAKISTDVYYYRHGMIVPVRTVAARWWSFKGSADHAVLLHGYDHRGSGYIWIMDPYDYTRFGHNSDEWEGPNPGGSHKLRLTELWDAVAAAGGWSVW